MVPSGRSQLNGSLQSLFDQAPEIDTRPIGIVVMGYVQSISNPPPPQHCCRVSKFDSYTTLEGRENPATDVHVPP